ncbi:DUF4167 domain-containing protein [Gemmobacter nectariphilus]|uniref:DUF4167 domain-containing protein n=1 Tax=Gemmobacter nectariphilus TaxID=220343 RepID=UPI000419A493|nr:DUF4167 domain-containing protein [Gemmobacter nectariphilus]
MRSSKSRSRSKQNRPRSIGNIVNRVFDSSGPEGKVRGTPQQIIEKYQALARDAQLSNDRVAAENFLQHAEHYTRMLGEAMRELAAEQEARRQQHGGQQGGNGNAGGNGQPQGGQDRPPYQPRRDEREDDQPEISGTAFALAVADEGDSGLVETPEARAERSPAQEPRREETRREDQPDRREDRRSQERRSSDRKPSEKRPDPRKADAPAADPVAITEAAPVAAETAEAPSKPRRSRSPRKPRASDDGAGTPAEGSSSETIVE